MKIHRTIPHTDPSFVASAKKDKSLRKILKQMGVAS
jgi:hypothetical protein